MPRILDEYTHCAVYIYKSLEDAKNGKRYGGSGFLCHVEFKMNRGWGTIYAVTNWHVVMKAKTPVIRFNRKDGATECVTTHMNDWFRHPDGDDLAVFPLDMEFEKLKIWSIPVGQFVTPSLIINEDIGIGDDTVMIGRFINHEGRQKNSPAVRFGNIAMMQQEKIITESGIEQEAFLVEVRSLPGYSGSAVLIYSPCAMNDMSNRRDGKTKEEDATERENDRIKRGLLLALPINWMNPKGPYLLGVDFCHIHRKAPVLDSNEKNVDQGWIVKENTGMAGVIPAWKILELLNGDELASIRDKEDKETTKEREESNPIE